MSIVNSFHYVKIDPFKGEDANADFQNWAKTAARNLLAAGIADEAQRARIIVSLMEGRAGLTKAAYYAELDRAGTTLKEFVTVNTVIEYFKPKFQQPNSELFLRQRLNDLKQTGTLEEYITREETLVGSTSIDGKFERMFYFINGLKEQVLKSVLDKNPRTFEEAKQHALAFVTKSETMSSMICKIERSEKPVKPKEEDFDDKMDVEAIFSKLKVHTEDIAAMVNRNSYNNNRNNSYGPKIVFAEPTKNRAPIDINSRLGKSYFISNNLCFKCGSSGHNSKSCSGKVHENSPTDTQNKDKGLRRFPNTSKELDEQLKNEDRLKGLGISESKSNLDKQFMEDRNLTEYRDSPIINMTDSSEDDQSYSDSSNLSSPGLYFNLNKDNLEAEKDVKSLTRRTSRLIVDDLVVSGDKRKQEDIQQESFKEAKLEEILSVENKFNSKRPILIGKINNNSVQVLLDSGASTSFISKNLVKNLNLKRNEIYNVSTYVANGNNISIKQECIIKLKLGKNEFELKVYVFPLDKVDIILGFDWWKKYK
ncbi:hypothetical protein BB558_007546, partial [Smittium angustum]